jgi:hypothetical protein
VIELDMNATFDLNHFKEELINSPIKPLPIPKRRKSNTLIKPVTSSSVLVSESLTQVKEIKKRDTRFAEIAVCFLFNCLSNSIYQSYKIYCIGFITIVVVVAIIRDQ